MSSKQINLATDFSKFPAGRFRSDGPNSGERFRDDLLVPALNNYERVVVVLDGAVGFGSSFIDEAFGGLVRNSGFTPSDLRKKLEIRSEKDPSYSDEAWDCIETTVQFAKVR